MPTLSPPCALRSPPLLPQPWLWRNAQRRGKHNDHGAWGETRCPSQTQTSQDRLGWGVGRWCGLGAGSWPWRWAWRVGLGLAAALIGTSALSTLIPSITDFATCCADGRP